ncbi:MAG: cellulase family glycosylhydrolase [Bacteroidales bacterium]
MLRFPKIFLILIVFVISFCSNDSGDNHSMENYLNGGEISIVNRRFIDSYGRQIILNGVNYINKNSSENYLNTDSARVYAKMHEMGINCIRLGLIWDAIEPEPGKFNEKFLDEIEKKIQMAAEHNIYIMLDMHQDLYSKKYSDGAPLWATLDENLPHQTGAIWSDAYLMSPAIQKAFDNFWDNKKAPDGIGIQDHYLNMWKHVAKRFLKYNNVLGYDIMNEPFNGSNANEIMPLILMEYAKMLVEKSGKNPPSEQELMMMWADENTRLEILKKLSDSTSYSRLLDAAFEPVKRFETTKLQAFYQKAADALREIDSTGILFFEHNYFSNPGIRSSIEPVKNKDGKVDPNQAYAAHGYDLVVDTKDDGNQSNSRVDLIFTRISQTSQRMNVPVLVGEWGAFSGLGDDFVQPVQFILSLFDKYHFGNTYWAYHSDMYEKTAFKKGLQRPYPQFVSGELKEFSFNREKGIFICKWTEKSGIQAPTVIYLPHLKALSKESIRFDTDNENAIVQSIAGSDAGYVIVPVSEKNADRFVEFHIIAEQQSIPFENNK